MSYKSNWLAILAHFKTKLSMHLTEPNPITAQALEETQTEFIAFVHGHSALLRNNAYDREVIEAFNLFTRNQDNNLSIDDSILCNAQNLINTIDTAITNNKEEAMTTNYNVSGNAQFGNNNSQTNTHNATDININLQTLINEIEKSGDPEAKSKLLDLLNNGTIASILGVTAAEAVKFFS
ncbi:hypothetical protein [Psychrobacter submarinus]|uniref:hypothetical protein n=1 Tax=Psychrobacter submarinus TaxID=154108 RepID=UPI00191A5307|nr:hypothetical protein [Psychrobacter submarinus]